jgi:hypothetical protein
VRQAQLGTAEAVRQLLRQPGAGRANVVLAFCGVVCASAWGVLAGVALVTGAGELGGFELAWLLGTGLSLTAAAFLLGRLALVERGALQLLATTYGAKAPRDAASGPRCRACGAPLPAAADALLVRCAYCEAENIVGVDLRTEVAPARARERELGDVLAGRRSARRRWLGASAGAGVLALVAGFQGAISISLALELSRDRGRCAGGDGESCAGVAAAYDLGIGVEENDGRACAYYRAACGFGHAESCYRLSEAVRWGWGVEVDIEAAGELRSRACRLGWAEACAPADDS